MRAAFFVIVGLLAALGLSVAYLMMSGLDASVPPGPVEQAIMGRLRKIAIPSGVANRKNPVPLDSPAMDDVASHYADHCAGCHGADGSGDTVLGSGLFPRPPDLRAESTQRQPDGALFYAIEHGVRFTGMPAFRTGMFEGELASWALVRLIRHMPDWSLEDVERVRALMPRSPAEVRRELEEERFLLGG
jgi:mono/diheme cytochrome c family protein